VLHQLLAETEEGISVLASFKAVSFAGAAVPVRTVNSRSVKATPADAD
jgi:hypothetical protein